MNANNWPKGIHVLNPDKKWWQFWKPSWILRRASECTQEEIEQALRMIARYRSVGP